MAKPFSIQSPEDIAKEYGGNKQKIGEAMQMGIVDPTAGVLAGMFIDRMRAAQMQEAVPQQTVAQQVMASPAPAQVPPAPQPGAPAGLGAIAPQGEASMPAPDMAPPQEAPMGMAMGGLAGLPVPDDMFDEPSNGGFNDGYAGGGIVAFADGGGLDLKALRRALLAQESSGDYGAINKSSGAMGGYQFMEPTARALAKRLGLPYRPELLTGEGGRSKEGVAYQERLMSEQLKDIQRFSGGDPKLAAAYHFAGPNREGWGAKTRKYQSDILRRMGMPGSSAEAPTGAEGYTEEPTRAALPEFSKSMAEAEDVFAGMPKSGLGELEAYYRKELSSEEREKARKEDMWSALAQLGASMASTTSPNFLQAVGESIAATLPGVEANKKERRAAERDANKGLAEVLGLKRAERKEVIDFAKDLRSQEIRAQEGETEREFRSREAAVDREWRSSEAALGRAENEQQFNRELAAKMALERGKGLEGLVDTYKDKLRAEAEAGTWKTPMGNKPSEATISHWAYQHAMKDWQTYMKSNAGAGGNWPTTLGGANAAPQGPWSQYQ